MISDIKVRTLTGSSLKTYLPSIARLRLEVLKEYPLLHTSTLEEESAKLKDFANNPESIAVLVFDGPNLIGASLGVPLDDVHPEVAQALLKFNLDPKSFYYFSESMILKKYRGRGLGHHFFDLREAHVKSLKKYDHICFCSVQRPEDDPQKPDDFISLENFWRKRGYAKHPEKKCLRYWRDAGEEEETPKRMVLWLRPLGPRLSQENIDYAEGK